jgi:hypothetical protein
MLMTDINPSEAAQALWLLIAQIEDGRLSAATHVRYRLEGAAMALEALSGEEGETAEALLERLGLH